MKARRRRTSVLAKALVAVLGLLTSGVIAAAPAMANDPFGTLELAGSSWFNGNGVNVYSNGAYGNVSNTYDHITVGGSSVNVGMEWQCVELAQRFYTVMGWHSGLFPGVNVAADIWSAASTMGMSTQANGSITSIVPGDMIIHGTSDTFSPGAGHVAIVDSVSGSTIHVVQQNAPANTTYMLSSQSLSGGSGTNILGVVHSPNNPNTVGSGGTGTGADRHPVSVIMPDGSYNVFSVAANGHLYQDVYNSSGWTGWIDKGAPSGVSLGGNPATFLSSDGGLNVFVVGGGHLYQDVYNSSGWTGWIDRGSAGGGLQGSPSVISYAGGLNVFTISTSGNLWQDAYNPSAGVWTGWIDKGTAATGFWYSPAVYAMPDGLNIFAVSGTGHLYQDVYNSSGWTGWIERGIPSGGSLGSTPAVVLNDGGLNVFVIGGGHLWQDAYNSSAGVWTGWIDRGGSLGGSPYAFAPGDGTVNVWASGGGTVYQDVYNSSGWTGWINRGTVSGGFGSPYVFNATDGSLNVWSVDNGTVYQDVYNSSGWTGWINRGTVSGGF